MGTESERKSDMYLSMSVMFTRAYKKRAIIAESLLLILAKFDCHIKMSFEKFPFGKLFSSKCIVRFATMNQMAIKC